MKILNAVGVLMYSLIYLQLIATEMNSEVPGLSYSP